MIFTITQETTAQEPAETAPEDDVEKFLNEQKAGEGKRAELIKDLLRQKEAAIKAFDEKLAKLGHRESGKSSRHSDHKHDADKKASA